jgi:hypothetical protein
MGNPDLDQLEDLSKGAEIFGIASFEQGKPMQFHYHVSNSRVFFGT